MTVLQFSDSRAAIAKALILAQGNMGDVAKTASNPAFKSRYADLAAVVEAVQPALQSAGIAVIQGAGTTFDESGALVTVETVLMHESGEHVSSSLALRPSKNDPQGIGSAITYARRYSLLAMCGVAPEDDDGNSASGKNGHAQQRPQPQRLATPPQEAEKPAVPTASGEALTQMLSALTPEQRHLIGEVAREKGMKPGRLLLHIRAVANGDTLPPGKVALLLDVLRKDTAA